MHDLDKFVSDATKIVSRSAPAKLAGELARHFEIWSRDYGTLGSMIAQYWKDRYSDSLGTEEGRKSALLWLEAALALISGNFSPSMDFPDEDWIELRELVSAEAEDLDLDLLTSILGIIVERGKA